VVAVAISSLNSSSSARKIVGVGRLSAGTSFEAGGKRIKLLVLL